MKINNIKISTINDEISPHIEEVVGFLKTAGIEYVEIRSIEGKNILDYSVDDLNKLYKYLEKNNIKVSAIASPLFKWYPDESNQTNSINIKTYFFDPNLGLENKILYINKALIAAKILQTKYVRIFSTLKAQGVMYDFMRDHLLLFALSQAQKRDVVLLLENEPPCYINTFKDIHKVMSDFSEKNLKLWFDVVNFTKVKNNNIVQYINELKGSIRYFHLKDIDEEGVPVSIGEGIIDYKKIIPKIRESFRDGEVYISIETHILNNTKDAVLKSYSFINKSLK